ncbi:MAG: energy transducer TonB [Proteobacteria bacterium]|nr:energy transducer TonB [Pseudomonadota bacterium]MDA1331259.1 energy transducer TonB [Pseudomonadota bacterium]
MFGKYRQVKALWPDLHLEEKRFLPWWAALVLALLIQVSPFLGGYLYGLWIPQVTLEDEGLPEIKMSVRLDERPPLEALKPPPPKPKEELPKPELEKIKNTIPLEPPRPLPDEISAEIKLPAHKPEEKEDEEEEEEPALQSVFQDARPVRKVPFPKYPREAEDESIEGNITVRIMVNGDGRVMDVQVVNANPPGVFNEEVLSSVRQWQFKRDGTFSEFEQKFIFKIDPWTKY